MLLKRIFFPKPKGVLMCEGELEKRLEKTLNDKNAASAARPFEVNKEKANFASDQNDAYTAYERELADWMHFFRSNMSDLMTLPKPKKRQFKKDVLKLIETLEK